MAKLFQQMFKSQERLGMQKHVKFASHEKNQRKTQACAYSLNFSFSLETILKFLVVKYFNQST